MDLIFALAAVASHLLLLEYALLNCFGTLVMSF